MKLLSLLGACFATLLTGCSANNGVKVLDHIEKKNAIVTTGTGTYTYSYNTNEVALGQYGYNYDNAYQYFLIGENYWYQSSINYDSQDDLIYVFKESVFNSTRWVFGFYDYYYTYNGTSVAFQRLYFSRKDAVIKYYVIDSLNRYFYDNNAWANYHIYLPEELSILDLASIGDSVVYSIAGNLQSSQAVVYGNNGNQAIMYYPCNDEDTLHNIDDDNYPFYGSGFSYYNSTNVSLMVNINSVLFNGDGLSFLSNTQQSVAFTYVRNDNSAYEQGYKDGYNLGTDEGYTDGYADGQSNGINTGYDSGYSTGYNTGYDDGVEEGSSVGYGEGFEEGKDVGYTQGFNAGAESANHYTFGALFASIADTPVLIFRQLFSFDLFGVSALTVILSLFTVLVVLFVAKKIIK